MRQPMSLRVRLTLTMAGLALAVCVALAYFTFRAASDIIEGAAHRTVDAVAEAQRTLVNRVLLGQSERLHAFDESLNVCSTEPCVDLAARRLLQREEADAVRITKPGLRPVEIGWEALGSVPTPRPDALAQIFRDASGKERYVITRTAHDGATVSIVWSAASLNPLFAHIPALGDSGETFLADPRAIVVTTTAREAKSGGPITTRPMKRCLAGEDGTDDDLDARGVTTIQGYRYLRALGGGCVMAHIDLYEAEAPVRKLERQVVMASVASAIAAIILAAISANRLSRSIDQLGQYARDLRGGDLAVTAGFELTLDRRNQLVDPFRRHRPLPQRDRQRSFQLAAIERFAPLLRLHYRQLAQLRPFEGREARPAILALAPPANR